jgi:hypothetical protein
VNLVLMRGLQFLLTCVVQIRDEAQLLQMLRRISEQRDVGLHPVALPFAGCPRSGPMPVVRDRFDCNTAIVISPHESTEHL